MTGSRQVSPGKRLFFQNAAILIAASLLMRTLGLGFGVYLSNRMGAEGMGLFQLVSTVYALASTFAVSGIYLTVTRLVAEETAAGNLSAAGDAVRKCMRYGLAVSLLAAVLLFAGAEWIAAVLLRDERTVLSLKILACSLPFMAFSSSLRGYFFALRMAGKSSASQLTEQLAHIFTAVTAFSLFVPPGNLELACAAAALGCTGGELLSFLFSLILYLRDRKKRRIPRRSHPEITRRMLRITVPAALSTYLKSALRTVEHLLIPFGLRKHGASGAGSLAQYGMTEAMVMPVLNFPNAFLNAFSSLLIPEIAEARAVGNTERIHRLSGQVLRSTLIFAVGVCGIFIYFSGEIGRALYRSRAAGSLIGLLAPLTPLMYLDDMADALLKGMDEQISVLRYSILDSCMSIGMLWFLLPLYGVSGYVAVLFASTFLNSTLSLSRLAAVTELQIQPVRWIFTPILCITIAAPLGSWIFRLILPDFSAFRLILQISGTSLLYLLLLKISGALSLS